MAGPNTGTRRTGRARNCSLKKLQVLFQQLMLLRLVLRLLLLQRER